MISYKRENMINKTPLESIKIGGYPAELMRAFMENRVFADYAKETVFGECEDAFERCIDGDEPNGLWQGEYWGKWVISAARASKYYGDESMKEYLHDAALRLLKHQREDGYIGTYKNSEQVTVLDGCIWNWNIWCRKYTLWGLLECYELSGDRVILDACVKFADQLIFEIKKSL